MGGGLMQLVAYGAQDVYLTGNPQITLFKVVYRRHTNFSVEVIELSLENAKPGGRHNVQVLRNGDLASKSYLRVVLPELRPSNAERFEGQVAWVRRLGHALIRNVEIQIGGAPIDKHYGVWLDVWYELTHVTGQERGYEAMIGDVDELTSLQTFVPGGYTLFIPLQFWYCRNYGLALPLIALQYHDVRLYFEFENLNKLYVYSRGCGRQQTPLFQNLQFVTAGVLVDYVYLDSEERRRFAQVGHEYLIEQLQTDGEQQLSATTSSTAASAQQFILNFNHPCKEFVWVHKLGAFNSSNDEEGWFLTYSNDKEYTQGAWDAAVQQAANSLARSMVSAPALNSGAAAPWTAAGSNAQTFTFNPASEPITVNVINGVTWKVISVNTVNVVPADVQTMHVLTNPITQGAINLADGLVDVTVELDFQDQAAPTTPVVTVTVSENNLSLVNLSIPLQPNASSAFADRRLDADKCADVHVIQPHNYSLTLDGTGNVVRDGLIILNGHDRFNRREGNYFGYVQPWQHHTRTPADGINVYSFALHPEQHQPTGTANMSRIDNTKLVYSTQDKLRQSPNQYAPLNYAIGTNVWIFATNYNVLRIMSGMGGLAYSN